MKYLYLVILLIIYSCNNNKSNNQKKVGNAFTTSDNVILNNEIIQMSNIFLDSIKKINCYKEMTINRILDTQYIITFKAKPFDTANVQKNTPLFAFLPRVGDTIFLYSGIEELVKGDLKNTNPSIINTADSIYFCMEFLFDGKQFQMSKTCSPLFMPQIKYVDPPQINLDKFRNKDSLK